MDRFANSLESDVKKDPKAIETEFRIFCKGTKGRENRLVLNCYYLDLLT